MKVFLILYAAAVTLLPARTPPWQDLANWSRLQKGMADTEVRRLLGPPVETEQIGDATLWFYVAPARTAAGKLAARPETAYVRFSQDLSGRRAVWRLASYAVPETVVVPVVDGKPVPMAALNDPAPAPTAPVQPPIRAEVPEPPAAIRSARRPYRSPPPAAPDPMSEMGSKYFIGCGILFGLAALGFAAAQTFRR